MNRLIQVPRVLAGVAVLASAALAAAQTPVCPDILKLVDAGLPAEVGDPAAMEEMLNPKLPAGPTSPNVDIIAVLKAVNDKGFRVDDSSCCTDKKCVYRNAEGSSLRVKAEQGRVVYLNPKRSESTEENLVPLDQAMEKVKDAAALIGLLDMDDASLHASEADEVGQPVDANGRPTGKASSRRAEIFVRFVRKAGGDHLVVGSKGTAVIDPKGDIARLHLTWPAFKLAEGLKSSDTIPRRVVLDALAAHLSQGNECGSLSRVHSKMAYIPTQGIPGFSSPEMPPPTGKGEPSDEMTYAPALIVYVTPVEQAEDSGKLQEAGLELVMPLLNVEP